MNYVDRRNKKQGVEDSEGINVISEELERTVFESGGEEILSAIYIRKAKHILAGLKQLGYRKPGTEAKMLSYKEFVAKYGDRPKDIIYDTALKLAADYYRKPGRLLSDKEIDDLCPTQDEIDLFLAEPTPPDELNQYLEATLPPEIKKQVAYRIVHCRKVAQAQYDQRGE